MSLPAHDPGFQRVGKSHFAATDAELDGAKANISAKAELRAQIYGLIVASGSDGMTGAEIEEVTGALRYSISGRLTELEEDSQIMKSGRRRKTATAKIAQNIYLKVPMEGTLL